MIKKYNYNSLDVCKLLMAFCVVAIHTCPLEHCDVIVINDIYDSFVSMAVPFFFLSSGFLLAKKFEFPLLAQENINIIKKQLLDGDYIILFSDGVLEGFLEEEKEMKNL